VYTLSQTTHPRMSQQAIQGLGRTSRDSKLDPSPGNVSIGHPGTQPNTQGLDRTRRDSANCSRLLGNCSRQSANCSRHLALNLQDALTWCNSAKFTGTRPILHNWLGPSLQISPNDTDTITIYKTTICSKLSTSQCIYNLICTTL
jgi:hypothetical protein